MNPQPRRARVGQAAREPRRVIRVLTEGAVTEPDYLASWGRGYRHVVQLSFDKNSAGLDPMSLVRAARRQQRRQSRRDPEFDEIWCVFDVDEHEDINSALAEARAADVNTAVSNPCFELWLVLHLEDQTAHVDRRTIQRRARELGLIAGKSIPESALSRLLIGYEEAKGRAQSLDAMHAGDGRDPGSNPSSGVWKLIESIRGGNVPD